MCALMFMLNGSLTEVSLKKRHDLTFPLSLGVIYQEKRGKKAFSSENITYRKSFSIRTLSPVCLSSTVKLRARVSIYVRFVCTGGSVR